MARVRDLPPTHAGGPSDGALALLLHARRFRLGAGAERIAKNLERHGGEILADAPVFVGRGRPPAAIPSLSLGELPGTLGPYSLGFIHVEAKIAAWDGLLEALPRRGHLGVIVGTATDLPDVPALLARHGLGVSWLISTGMGDPASALRFLNHDKSTTAIALFGAHAESRGLRALVGVKPTVVLGGDRALHAMVRAGGGVVSTELHDWLSAARLLTLPQALAAPPEVVVIGAGRSFVEAQLAERGLAWRVREVASIDELTPVASPVLLCGNGALPSRDDDESAVRIAVDLLAPGQLATMVDAIARRLAVVAPMPAATLDRVLRDRVRGEVDVTLTDHDGKRLLKAYGARVTRQAPTNTPTGATKLARTVGLPVVIERHGEQRVAASLPDVRRETALLLEMPLSDEESRLGLSPSVMVRERVPEAPRCRVRVHTDRDLGPLIKVGEEVALLPLSDEEARRLATATQARRAGDQHAVAAQLLAIAACATAERATLELELFVGAEPMIVTAKGALPERRGSAPEAEDSTELAAPPADEP